MYSELIFMRYKLMFVPGSYKKLIFSNCAHKCFVKICNISRLNVTLSRASITYFHTATYHSVLHQCENIHTVRTTINNHSTKQYCLVL